MTSGNSDARHDGTRSLAAAEASPAATVAVDEYADADYAAVLGLWRRSGLWMRPSDGREQIALKRRRDRDLFLVARAGAEVVGSVMGGWDGRRAYVYHLAVDPDRRRRGVAGALMDELERRLRGKGALKVKLQVLEGNESSQRFFAQRGYEVETMCIPYGKELVAGGAPFDGAPGGALPVHDPNRQGDETR